MTISVQEILAAGVHTRGETELWVAVEDALTPKCGHSEHFSRPEWHGGEVHRLIRVEHPCFRTGEEGYLCDKFWNHVETGVYICRHCHEKVTTADYVVLAVF